MQSDDNVDFYHSGDQDSNQQNLQPPPSPDDSGGNRPAHSNRAMSWTAPEYQEHDHGMGWYSGLLLVIFVLAAALYFLSKDYFAVGSVIVVGIIFAVFVSRKPNIIDYRLSDSGLSIGKRDYTFSQFKSFTIVREGDLSSVELLPLKRFMLPVSALFPSEDEKRVAEIIGEHLPYAEHKPGLIDKLSQRLHL